jgi:hypothetical protein
MKTYNPNAEERAFLYQEAQDLEALLKNLGPVSITVEKSDKELRAKKNKNYRVRFTIAPESVGMIVEAVGPNLFDTTIAAKEETQKALNALVNSLPRHFNVEKGMVKIPTELLH